MYVHEAEPFHVLFMATASASPANRSTMAAALGGGGALGGLLGLGTAGQGRADGAGVSAGAGARGGGFRHVLPGTSLFDALHVPPTPPPVPAHGAGAADGRDAPALVMPVVASRDRIAQLPAQADHDDVDDDRGLGGSAVPVRGALETLMNVRDRPAVVTGMHHVGDDAVAQHDPPVAPSTVPASAVAAAAASASAATVAVVEVWVLSDADTGDSAGGGERMSTRVAAAVSVTDLSLRRPDMLAYRPPDTTTTATGNAPTYPPVPSKSLCCCYSTLLPSPWCILH